MRLLGRPCGLRCRVGPSVVAAGARRGGMRWLPMAVPVDGRWLGEMGACGVRMLVVVCAVPVVLVRAVPVLCLADGV